jgi:hypothetical protein
MTAEWFGNQYNRAEKVAMSLVDSFDEEPGLCGIAVCYDDSEGFFVEVRIVKGYDFRVPKSRNRVKIKKVVREKAVAL